MSKQKKENTNISEEEVREAEGVSAAGDSTDQKKEMEAGWNDTLKPEPAEETDGEESNTAENGDNGEEPAPEDKAGQLEAEIAELKDRLLRERAEFQNFKKRTAGEVAKTRQWTINQFAADLLPTLDNLDMVLSADKESGQLEDFVKGVELIRKELTGALGKNNIKEINPDGEEFDPATMEALQMEESAEVEKETVVQVFQKGYVVKMEEGNHVVRAARVKVARPGGS